MRGTILCAEDERRIRQYMQQELQADGYCVLVTVDGLEALEVLDSRVVDLVILDEHMPRLSGLETARRIKELDPTLPIVLFTCDLDYENCRSPFIDAAIIKSEDLAQLKSDVAALLVDELAASAEPASVGKGTS